MRTAASNGGGVREMGSVVELFTIAAERNHVAVLYYAPRRPRSVTLVAGHGYSSSKQNLDLLCSFLASNGFAVYNLDFPGHKLGASGGLLRGVDDCIDAMNAVVRFARERGAETTYTMGHSMGGMTALLTACLDPRIDGCVAIATGFGRPSALWALQKGGGSIDLRSSYVNGVTLPELVDGVEDRYARLLPFLAGRPALYVAANRDAMVNPASVHELYQRAPEPKRLETIESDHTYAGERARGTILRWLSERHPRA